MMNTIRFLGFVALAGIFAGCGTVASKASGSWGRAYSGVECSGTVTALTANPPNHNRATWIILPFAAVDTVLSAIADTVLAPVDLAVGNRDKKRHGSQCIGLAL